MDIYILRDGKETGPLSEETTQSMLKQGSIMINDLAWRPGMPNWQPLHAVLYPAAQPDAVRPPPPPRDATPPPMPAAPGLPAVPAAKPPIALAKAAAPAPAPEPLGELATSRQKAFLSYMAIPFAGDVTREQAALLVNEAMENPKDTSRLQRWNEDRLRLHPDLFTEEIKARKENRANHFFEICQREGAEFFEKVTKAHTQVLVGYLDVRFPNWDLREDEAKYSYFFPAIAEKFPQLLVKGAKGKFKYPDGPKVAPELSRHSAATTRSGSSSSPVAAMLRGVVFGAILLGAGFVAWSYSKGRWPASVAATSANPDVPAAANATPPTATPAPQPPKRSPAPPTETTADNPPPPPGTDVPPAKAAETPPKPVAITAPKPPAAVASGTGTPANPLATMNIFDGPAAPPPAATPGVATVSNPFDPLAPTAPVPIAPKEPVVPTGPPPRSTVKITKATTIALRFGSSTQRAGTVLPFVGVEGNMVKVKIGSEVVSIPAANTDIAESDPVVPAPAPAPPENSP